MTTSETLAAYDAIRQAKARYWRGVDTGDGDLVRAMLAPDCHLDYSGCCADPQSGVDFLPVMNVIVEGREMWPKGKSNLSGIVTAHQGHQSEVWLTGPDTASSIYAFTDRLHFPAGAPFSRLVGHGYYHEDWEHYGNDWLLKSLRITRLRVEVD